VEQSLPVDGFAEAYKCDLYFWVGLQNQVVSYMWEGHCKGV